MWVKVTRPSGEYTITGGLATGWSPSSTSSDATFTSATQVDPSGTSFNVHANTGSSDVGSQNWTVQIADNGSGSSPTTCTGNLGTSISGASGVTPTPTPTATPTPDVTGSGISSINVSNISEKSVLNVTTGGVRSGIGVGVGVGVITVETFTVTVVEVEEVAKVKSPDCEVLPNASVVVILA